MSTPKKPDDFDDFSKTTPFFDPSQRKSERESSYESSWEKTNYININEPKKTSSESSWERASRSEPDESDKISSFVYASEEERDKTRAYILPTEPSRREETVRRPATERLSRLESTTSVAAEAKIPTREVKSEEKNKGIPALFLYLMIGLMFFLLAGTLIISYLLFSKKYGFDVTLVGAHPNSDVFVDGVRWGISSSDGSIRLLGLRAGEHRIEVKNPNYVYETETVRGNDGERTKVTLKYKAKTAPQPSPVKDECAQIKKGEFEKAARCANEALDKLGDKFTVEELLRAMNLYIINFDSGKYDIKPKDMEFLKKAAGYMKKLPPNVKIEIGGHTDNVGGDEYNMKLSENRAKAVRDALVSFGISPDMLELRGYGKTRPKDSNDTEDGRFRNRRIEYTAIIRNQ